MIEKSDAAARLKSLWHNPGEPLALGCSGCPDFATCGGMQVAAPIFSCMDHCNCDRAFCQKVCPSNKNFIHRVHEVRGLEFDDIEKRASIPLLPLPRFAQLLYNHPKVENDIALPIAAVPLSAAFNKSGKKGTALTRLEIERRFRLSAGTPLILSGAELDHRIEKFWGVTTGRTDMLAGIRDLNPLIVTTPNYSVGLDGPRHEAMHSLKRILLSWSELHDAGLRTALHLNAVTDRDYERLAEFLAYHTEIHAVSLEYETGAAIQEQGAYHAEQLDRLVQRIGRSPHLMFRGDIDWVPKLSKTFPNITLLNSSASIRTRKRRRAIYADGVVRWTSSPTAKGAYLDELLQHNLAKVAEWLTDKTQGTPVRRVIPIRTQQKQQTKSMVDAKAHNKPAQMGLL